LAVVLGVVFGYIMTAFFNILNEKYNWISWRWAFYFQFSVLSLVVFVLYKVPEEKLATNGILSS